MKKQITSITVHIIVMCIFIGMNRFHVLAQEQPDSVLVNSIGGFTKNMGQLLDTESEVAEGVHYYSGSGNINYYLLDNSVAFVFNQGINQEDEDSLYRVDMTFDFCNERPDTVYEGNQMFYKNFYLAHTGSGIDSVSVLDSVTYQNLVSGFNISYKMVNGLLMQFEIDNEASLEHLILNFDESDSIVDSDIAGGGYLAIYTPGGTITFDSLFAYQILDNTVIPIECGVSTDERGFKFEADMVDPDGNVFIVLGNKSSTVVAVPSGDPPIANTITNYWSTFLDPLNIIDWILDVFIDENNFVYCTGKTMSPLFPILNGQFVVFLGDDDAFVVKFSPYRSAVWGSYLGGSDFDAALTVVGNSSGYTYIAGQTKSSDLSICSNCSPISNLLSNTSFNGGDRDIFVAKFDPTGMIDPMSSFSDVFITYLGGTGGEDVIAMTIDSDDNVYIGGRVEYPSSLDFPNVFLSGGYNQDNNIDPLDESEYSFIFKITNDDDVTWSTQIGGIAQEAAIGGLCVDRFDNLYAFGGTTALSGYVTLEQGPVYTNANKTFPLVDPDFGSSTEYVEMPKGLWDAFIIKFNNDRAIEWSTFYGSTQLENHQLHPSTFGAVSTDLGIRQVGIDVDYFGNIFITGTTNGDYSDDFPEVILNDAYNQTNGNAGFEDAYLAKFNSDFELVWSTLIGGWNQDIGSGLAVSKTSYDGNLFITGETPSNDFPLKNMNNSYFQNYSSGYNGYLMFFFTNGYYNYSTLQGGDIYSQPRAITTDLTGNHVVIAGLASHLSGGTNFPFALPLQGLAPSPPYFQNAMNSFWPGESFISNFLFSYGTPMRSIEINTQRNCAQDFIVFPNPASEYIYMSDDKLSDIEIHNSTGMLVFRETNARNGRISIKNLDQGIYFIKCMDSEGKYLTSRFVVSK